MEKDLNLGDGKLCRVVVLRTCTGHLAHRNIGGAFRLAGIPSCVDAVAFLVFFPRATGARVVAAYFRGGADRLRRFGLGRAGLILQIFLLTFCLRSSWRGYVG